MCNLQRNYDVIRNWERFETGPLTVMIFNKSGKFITSNKFTYNNEPVEYVQEFKHLGLYIIKASGIFTKGISELSIYNQEKNQSTHIFPFLTIQQDL